jgi:hypothetical protein
MLVPQSRNHLALAFVIGRAVLDGIEPFLMGEIDVGEIGKNRLEQGKKIGRVAIPLARSLLEMGTLDISRHGFLRQCSHTVCFFERLTYVKLTTMFRMGQLGAIEVPYSVLPIPCRMMASTWPLML